MTMYGDYNGSESYARETCSHRNLSDSNLKHYWFKRFCMVVRK